VLITDYNNKQTYSILFADIQSDRIFKTSESIIPGKYEDVYYSLTYFIIVSMRKMYLEYPVFNEKFMLKFLVIEKPNEFDGEHKKYYTLIEDFVFKHYNISIKIKAPYLVAGWPAYGYF
jgi:hypothetical protein